MFNYGLAVSRYRQVGHTAVNFLLLLRYLLTGKEAFVYVRYSLFEYDKLCIVIIRILELFKLYMLLSRGTKRGLF